jgi:uncharacterized membrane protein
MKINFTKNSLYFSLVCNLLLILISMIHFMSLHYVFLIWNLFLAFIPYYLSRKLLAVKRQLFYIPLVGFMLLFLPNAPYIITDLSHLVHSTPATFWFDLILISFSAINGLFLFVYALQHLKQFLKKYFREKTVQIIVISVILICSYGVYIGRFLRWNSWDIFIYPYTLLTDCYHSTGMYTIAFTSFLSVVLFSFYLLFGMNRS